MHLEKDEALPGQAVNPAPVRESIWWTFAGASALMIVSAIVYASMLKTSAPDGLRVFGSFWASGWAAAHHQNPYATYPLTWVFHLPGHPGKVVDLNLSPPAMLPLFVALSWFDPNVGVVVWTLMTALIVIGCAALLIVQYPGQIQHRQILWLLLARAVLNTMGLGQDYALFIGLAVGAWILLERNRQIAAGIFLGLLIAFKPNYVLWVVLLVFCGRWKASAVAAGVAAALCALPLALYGPGIYGEWMRGVAGDPHWFFPNEVSISGFATRIGHPRVGQGLAAILLAGSCGVVVWKRPSLRNTSGIALSVGMLASPLAWFHYALLMAGPLFAKRWDLVLSLMLLLLMLPFAGFWYLLPVCYVAGYFLIAAVREPRTIPV
ncbi:MAG: glycosyltransferase family 87 protein [Acidobacteriaceae bacterium]